MGSEQFQDRPAGADLDIIGMGSKAQKLAEPLI
jgi:hypothetical protein